MTRKPLLFDSTAWCECGDSLNCKRIYKTDKHGVKYIHTWEYYCMGCDKTYILVDKKEYIQLAKEIHDLAVLIKKQ